MSINIKNIQMLNLLAEIKKLHFSIQCLQSNESCNKFDLSNIRKIQTLVFYAQATLEHMQIQSEQNKFKELNEIKELKTERYRSIFNKVNLPPEQ